MKLKEKKIMGHFSSPVHPLFSHQPRGIFPGTDDHRPFTSRTNHQINFPSSLSR